MNTIKQTLSVLVLSPLLCLWCVVVAAFVTIITGQSATEQERELGDVEGIR